MLSAPPRLLNGLLNICMEQRFVTATINVIEFSQLLTQALVAPHRLATPTRCCSRPEFTVRWLPR